MASSSMPAEDRASPASSAMPVAPPKRRVLWLIKGLDIGGAERLLVNLAEVHDRAAFDFEVAYVLPGRSGMVAELEAAGITAYCLGSDHDFDLRWAGRLRRLVRERRYDIVHLHLRYTATVGRLVIMTLPRRQRPRIVFTEHNVWGQDVWLTRFTNWLTMGLDDAEVAVSRLVRESLPRRLQSRMQIVVHGVSRHQIETALAEAASVRAELGVQPGEVLIGTVANFRAQKGYNVLLPAAKAMIDEGLPVRFVAVGHGPLAGEIESMHSELGLGDRFMILGTRNDAIRIIAGCDIFVLASLFEGFPVSVMEALAVGTPVVATAVGAIPEAVADGVEGRVVPPGRADLLASALRELVVDPSLRATMHTAALRRGEEYDIRIAARRLEAIYRDVLSHPR